MANEDYDSEDIILESEITEDSDELVPVISRETDAEESLLDQGIKELEDTQAVNTALEHYLELLQSAGAAGLSEQAYKTLKIGLEHLDYLTPEFTLSTAFESYNPDECFTLRNIPALENGFKDKLKAGYEKVKRLIEWIVEQAHRIYTRYKEGIYKLPKKIKELEYRVSKLKDVKDLTFTLSNAQDISVKGKVDSKDIRLILGIAEWLSNEQPNDTMTTVKKSTEVLKKFIQTKDAETFIELSTLQQEHDNKQRRHFSAWPEILPGEYYLTLGGSPDGFNFGESVEDGEVDVRRKGDVEPYDLELDVSSTAEIKAKTVVLLDIAKKLEKASVENVKLNRVLKDYSKSFNEAIKSLDSGGDIENVADRAIGGNFEGAGKRVDFSKQVTQTSLGPEHENTGYLNERFAYTLVEPTKSMLNLLRYIIKTVIQYLAVCEQEVKLLEQNQPEK